MRRQARQWALMILYGMDVARTRADRAVPQFFSSFGTGEPLETLPGWDHATAYRVGVEPERSEEARRFTEDRVAGVAEHLDDLDARIQAVSKKWRLERMAVLDRNVLRLGAFEVLHRGEDVPRAVAINEAVELAKTFGTKEAGAFVNGILDRIAG